MRQLHTDTSFQEVQFRIGQKINHHLTGLDSGRKDDNQKILELCQIGKLIGSYFNDFEIKKVSERPDFLISNGQQVIGLEHQLILDTESKSKEGFYENIFDKVEANLRQNSALPNFLLNLIIRRNADLKINNKNAIITQVTNILGNFILTGELEENDFILSAHKMRHSRKSVNANYGAYLQKTIDKGLILEFLKKKEEKIESYIENSVTRQWLVLVIGGLGESSYEVENKFEINMETKFEKVFLYEDFRNRLYELK
jgi:hypothetical protein